MSKAAQLTAEGAAAISQRQLEMLRATSEQLATALRDMKLSSQQQSEFAGKTFEAALASTRELAEMTVKSNTEVFNVVKQKMTEDKVWEKMNADRFDKVMLKTKTVGAKPTETGIEVRFECEQAPAEPQVYDLVLVSVGRSPNGKKDRR
jgi:phasin family protein